MTPTEQYHMNMTMQMSKPWHSQQDRPLGPTTITIFEHDPETHIDIPLLSGISIEAGIEVINARRRQIESEYDPGSMLLKSKNFWHETTERCSVPGCRTVEWLRAYRKMKIASAAAERLKEGTAPPSFKSIEMQFNDLMRQVSDGMPPFEAALPASQWEAIGDGLEGVRSHASSELCFMGKRRPGRIGVPCIVTGPKDGPRPVIALFNDLLANDSPYKITQETIRIIRHGRSKFPEGSASWREISRIADMLSTYLRPLPNAERIGDLFAEEFARQFNAALMGAITKAKP